MSDYYLTPDGTARQGPFTLDQLRQKQIQPWNMVWTEGMRDWAAAITVPELKSLFSQTPSDAPAVAVSPPIAAIAAPTFDVTLNSKRARLSFEGEWLEILAKKTFGWSLLKKRFVSEIFNVSALGRHVTFSQRLGDGNAETVSFTAANNADAAKIAALLPKTVTEEFKASRAAEQQKLGALKSALGGGARQAIVTRIIIGINVLVFVAMCISGAGVDGVSGKSALKWGADYWPLTTTTDWWRLLTSAFVHFGIVHVGLNMWALYQAGGFTERLFGKRFYVLLYLYGAIMSSIAATWWDRDAVGAGASGAIFAVYGALLAFLVVQGRDFPTQVLQSLKKSTVTFIGYNVFFGLSVAGISNAAHLGGLVSGFVLGLIVCRPLDAALRQRQLWPRLMAGLVFSAATCAGAIVLMPKDYEQMLAIGYSYDVGDGAPQDYARAMYWYRKSAAGGNADAAFDIGVLYENGQGVPRDYAEAAKWYRKASDEGSPEAMNGMGALYDEGHGVPRDDAQAMAWFLKAAGKGNADAMENIANLYFYRAGVAKDAATARLWYQRAADAGNDDAKKWLRDNPQ